MSAIEEHNADLPIKLEIEQPESFEVKDEASANWVIRKITDARSYAAHVKAWAEGELNRAKREEAFFLLRFGQQLERWAKSRIGKSRRKSVKLPAGTVGYRTEPIKLDVKNVEKLIAWCRSSLPSALKIETRILKKDIKDHITSTGECPDGAEITGGQEKFYVR